MYKFSRRRRLGLTVFVRKTVKKFLFILLILSKIFSLNKNPFIIILRDAHSLLKS